MSFEYHQILCPTGWICCSWHATDPTSPMAWAHNPCYQPAQTWYCWFALQDLRFDNWAQPFAYRKPRRSQDWSSRSPYAYHVDKCVTIAFLCSGWRQWGPFGIEPWLCFRWSRWPGALVVAPPWRPYVPWVLWRRGIARVCCCEWHWWSWRNADGLEKLAGGEKRAAWPDTDERKAVGHRESKVQRKERKFSISPFDGQVSSQLMIKAFIVC